MKLCKFSKSANYKHLILSKCPLLLSSAEYHKCPCRKRVKLPNDLRVLTCTHPKLWNDEPLTNPESVKANIRKHIKNKKETRDMTAAQEAPAKDTTEAKLQGTPAIPTTSGALVPITIEQFNPIKGMLLAKSNEEAKSNIEWYAKHLMNSAMVGVQNVSQGVVLAVEMCQRGILPTNFRSRFHIIGGNVTLSSEAMLADFEKSGGSWRYLSMTPDLGSIELKRGKDKQVFSFSWKEAMDEDYVWTKAANNGEVKKILPNGEVNRHALKDNWKTPRRRKAMLLWRCISEGIGFMAPNVSAGQLTMEEKDVMRSLVDAREEHEDIVITSEPAETEPPEAPFEDAEYEVKSEQASAVELPASQQSTTGPTEAPQPQPERPQAAPTASAASEYKDHPTPVPPPSEADIEARRQSLSARRTANILRCKQIYDIIKPSPEKWAKALAAYRVENVRSMDDEQLEHFCTRLEAKLKETQMATGTDPMSQYLQKQLEKKV